MAETGEKRVSNGTESSSPGTEPEIMRGAHERGNGFAPEPLAAVGQRSQRVGVGRDSVVTAMIMGWGSIS